MDRRDFIKVSGLATAGFAIPGLKAEAKVHNQEQAIAKSFTFNSKGKFKILQITDTHYIIGDERSSHVRDNITYWVQTERPDLIIHTGDVVNDGNRARKDGEESMRLVLGWLADFKIPFAVTLGNHDGQYELSRSEMFKVIQEVFRNGCSICSIRVIPPTSRCARAVSTTTSISTRSAGTGTGHPISPP